MTPSDCGSGRTMLTAFQADRRTRRRRHEEVGKLKRGCDPKGDLLPPLWVLRRPVFGVNLSLNL